MMTLAKLEANRRNALRSTGPRTFAGKAVVARNAVTHGVFARLPVVPGECAADWETHRAQIVASLRPVGLLELTLAERAALLLWRLARLARYEAAETTALVEDSSLPPPGTDPFVYTFPGHPTEDHLKLTEQSLRRAREDLAVVRPEAHLLRRLNQYDGLDPLPPGPVRGVLNAACELAIECPVRKYDPALPFSKDFLTRVGVTGPPDEVAWTRENLLAGLGYYADSVGTMPADFRSEVQAHLDAQAAAFARTIDRLEADAAALTRRVTAERDRASAAALLPPEWIAERVMKYERHLHSQLTSTLHELERLQGRRAGAAVLPPLVADIQITAAPGSE